MSFLQALLLFFTALLGGTLNSVAGGGTFFTVPALIFTNVLPTISNATSTVALWPGSVASTGAYRRELETQNRVLLVVLIVTSLIGGILGAILLLHTPQDTFVHLLPFLLLIATLLFIFSGPITARLRRQAVSEKTQLSRSTLVGISVAQLVISVYGGYFGGGIGILMLATLAMMGMQDIHSMNGLKTLLASCINGVAVITFIIAGAVLWPQAIVMVIGAIIGGYGGAYYARKIEQKYIRIFVAIVGIAMTIVFFLR
jgi:uncharacterized membrane protein YfcA